MPLIIRSHIKYDPPRVVAPEPRKPPREARGRRKGDVGILMVDWTDEDVATLGKLMAAGYVWTEIAAQLGRSTTSCQSKAYRAGFVLAVSGDTRRRA